MFTLKRFENAPALFHGLDTEGSHKLTIGRPKLGIMPHHFFNNTPSCYKEKNYRVKKQTSRQHSNRKSNNTHIKFAYA